MSPILSRRKASSAEWKGEWACGKKGERSVGAEKSPCRDPPCEHAVPPGATAATPACALAAAAASKLNGFGRPKKGGVFGAVSF